MKRWSYQEIFSAVTQFWVLGIHWQRLSCLDSLEVFLIQPNIPSNLPVSDRTDFSGRQSCFSQLGGYLRKM